MSVEMAPGNGQRRATGIPAHVLSSRWPAPN